MRKVFIKVIVSYSPEGVITPKSFIWDDGRMFDIDRVVGIRRAANHVVGGLGFRYDCMVMGKKVSLRLDDGRWFMEGK
jgi:hypothetical protein